MVILLGHDTRCCFYPSDFHFLNCTQPNRWHHGNFDVGILICVDTNIYVCIVASTMDKDMINILASLAEESTQPGSQRTASQSFILDTGTNTTSSCLIGHFFAVQKLAHSAGPV